MEPEQKTLPEPEGSSSPGQIAHKKATEHFNALQDIVGNYPGAGIVAMFVFSDGEDGGGKCHGGSLITGNRYILPGLVHELEEEVYETISDNKRTVVED